MPLNNVASAMGKTMSQNSACRSRRFVLSVITNVVHRVASFPGAHGVPRDTRNARVSIAQRLAGQFEEHVVQGGRAAGEMADVHAGGAQHAE